MKWASRMEAKIEKVIHLDVMLASVQSKDEHRAPYFVCLTLKGSSKVEHLVGWMIVMLANHNLMGFQKDGYLVHC